MPFLANDRLDPERSHGDLLLALQGKEPDVCAARAAPGSCGAPGPGWCCTGCWTAFTRPDAQARGSARPQSRNLLGFKDGTANPDAGGRRR